MKKIKLAYIVHGLGFEGISTFTCSLMQHLDKSQFDVTIVMAVDKNGIPQKREEEVADCKILRTCDLGSISRMYAHLCMLKEILITEGPFDVIHSNMDKLNGKLKGCKRGGNTKAHQPFSLCK